MLTWLGALVEQHTVMLGHRAEFAPSCFRSAQWIRYAHFFRTESDLRWARICGLLPAIWHCHATEAAVPQLLLPLPLPSRPSPGSAALSTAAGAVAGSGGPWLAEVVAAVLVRASAVAPTQGAAPAASWPASWDAFSGLLARHLAALKVLRPPRPHSLRASLVLHPAVMPSSLQAPLFLMSHGPPSICDRVGTRVLPSLRRSCCQRHAWEVRLRPRTTLPHHFITVCGWRGDAQALHSKGDPTAAREAQDAVPVVLIRCTSQCCSTALSQCGGQHFGRSLRCPSH